MSHLIYQARAHESAVRHVSGAARYIDDLPEPTALRHAWVVQSPKASARILDIDIAAAQAVPGIDAVLLAKDIPGQHKIGPIVHDEPVLALDEVLYHGQPMVLLIGKDRETCRKAASSIQIRWKDQEPVFTIQKAIEVQSFLTLPHRIARGDVENALNSAKYRISGEVFNGGQDHFYLETQVAMVIPEEDNVWKVFSSTQHPSEVQAEVAAVLGIGRHQVSVEVPRLGGGFGGKESQASNIAVLAALGAYAVNAPVKLWLDRHQDMTWTGKRHPFWSTYEAGLDAAGRLCGVKVKIFSNGGCSSDLSPAVMDRALFHLDNCYFIPHLEFEGRVCKTNLPSNTAFRGFGGPQGVLVIETILQHAAEQLGKDPAELRRVNFYGQAPRDRAPFEQQVPEDRSERIFHELTASAEYFSRRNDIKTFNQENQYFKRGLAYVPVKFGISFTNAMLNQAGALVLIYADGTVQLNHGGIEMGQGLNTKLLAIVSDELGISINNIRMMNTSTEKVPNTSPTAASCGTDLNGMAVREACLILRERLAEIGAVRLECSKQELVFAADKLTAVNGSSISMAELARIAWMERIGLSAVGYYRTPGIAYDRLVGRGTPFHYFAYGAAVVEVELCGLTGEFRLRRVDILHDCGKSLNPAIDIGQIEGAFIQGAGWLTCEEVRFGEDGRLLTTGPSTYKIPAAGDVPRDFRVSLLENASQTSAIHGSKAVGEPPLVLGIGVVMALREAVGAFGNSAAVLEIALPYTPENLLTAVERRREQRW